MGLNKSKGNMYPWVTHTWNVIKGKCPHDCSYCYMKRYPQPKLHFDEKELKTDLGSGNFIFVGSSCDMWADEIIEEWIELVLEHCRLSPQNIYLLQTSRIVYVSVIILLAISMKSIKLGHDTVCSCLDRLIIWLLIALKRLD